MGNTHSSFGTIVGSILGGLLIAPFTDWPTFVAIIIASCIGIIVGTTTFIYNTLHKNVSQKKEQKRNLIVGTAYGTILLVCGYTCTLDDKMFFFAMIILNQLMNWAVEMIRIENSVQ
jgi:MFS family permease